ncbi:hypothetical protein ZEAMMB73_Zm00001d002448 [Zea mays]|uniref:Uncharacterized protein n=1 Tax=Zea mays TaxID=4577 RepID=A0A1D6E0T1_MAIZE|nr:hypothetical protein ZEAMMB73_Zm00001d002448 [Zea mays]
MGYIGDKVNQGEQMNWQVLLDNVDVKTLQLKQLRDQTGLMNQEPALFASTILENILDGKPDATISLKEKIQLHFTSLLFMEQIGTDELMWSWDLTQHAAGEFSFAMVQANDVL